MDMAKTSVCETSGWLALQYDLECWAENLGAFQSASLPCAGFLSLQSLCGMLPITTLKSMWHPALSSLGPRDFMCHKKATVQKITHSTQTGLQ